MADLRLGVIETRFAEIIWENEPIVSSAIVKLAEARLSWKKSTTYTVLKRLCDKGIFQNNNGTVSSLISRQEFFALQSERFVEDTFAGSLPAFLAEHHCQLSCAGHCAATYFVEESTQVATLQSLGVGGHSADAALLF